MRTPWPVAPLGELCDVQIGKTPTRAEKRFWGDDHPWLSISDMNQGRCLRETSERVAQTAVDELNLRRVEPGTVLLSFKLSIGKVGIAAAPMYTNEAIAHLPIVDERLERNYLYWALRSIPLTSGADRAAMGATLNKAKLKQLPIPLPPIEEQRRIAAVLDAVDVLRNKRRQAVATLDALRDSVVAQELRNHQGRESLGDYLMFVTSGSRGWAKYYSDRGSRFIRSQDVLLGSIDDTDPAFVDPPDNSESKRTAIRSGDLLITITGTVGRAAAAPTDLDGAFISQHVAIVRPGSALRSRFAEAFVCARDGQAQLERAQYGQTKPGLNLTQIREFKLPVPDLAAQDDLVRRLEGLNRCREKLRESEVAFGSLFASLHQRAFRGEL